MINTLFSPMISMFNCQYCAGSSEKSQTSLLGEAVFISLVCSVAEPLLRAEELGRVGFINESAPCSNSSALRAVRSAPSPGSEAVNADPIKLMAKLVAKTELSTPQCDSIVPHIINVVELCQRCTESRRRRQCVSSQGSSDHGSRYHCCCCHCEEVVLLDNAGNDRE
ncbi:hypothetical protein KC19_9G150300 [Ceratodon purpureus]|uniref:Uncharacterized protein n=1 Tax=Ceratodon purpureus TaxID=3225 RepID=A0A8T0GU94_CERPU|nr:hypothetical protein KC19_N005600 [Ceratodon purpureus]KAG0562483.1 hypothetical protein KC19_9G150300 [Ceratodon purpureus]